MASAKSATSSASAAAGPSDLELANEFVEFVNKSPSAFHAVDTSVEMLKKHGFQKLNEGKEDEFRNLKPGGRYYFTRNQSTVFAFVVGGAYQPGNGFSIAAAHTDSPVLKVKPNSKREKAGYLCVGVECYGGGLWHTWFDRDLSVAGRVLVASEDDTRFESRLVCIKRPILRIPSLAIHLDRSVNEKGFDFNKETQLLPMIATAVKATLGGNEKSKEAVHHSILVKLIAEELQVSENRIRDFELSLYDTQPAQIGGAMNEFIFSARLDNLMMSFCCLKSLLNSLKDGPVDKDPTIRMIALFDNEEVGSASTRGADSNMMIATLERLVGKRDLVTQAIHKSFLISADMAHALHPNYSDKHEENHRPALHKGLVVKHNANQRYATTSITAFVMRELAKRHNIPLQDFCVRNDSVCGSTIGPILASNCGMRTVDVGVPQLSMHSIRETCGTGDVGHAVNLLTAFFSEFPALDASIVVD